MHRQQQEQRGGEQRHLGPLRDDLETPEIDRADHQAQETEPRERQREEPEVVQRPGGELGDHLDHEQVEQDAHGAREAVLAVTEAARVVVHLHLQHARARRARHRRQEAVLLGVDRQVLDDLAAEGLERAAGVVHRRAGHPGDQAVGGPGGNAPQEEAVVAPPPPAGDDVEALFQGGHHARDVGRIVLQVAVQRDHHLPVGAVEARGQRRGLTGVAAEADHMNARVARAQRQHRGQAPVGRAVVHQDQLPAGGRARAIAFAVQRRADLLVQHGQALLLVEHGDDDGEIQRPRHVPEPTPWAGPG